MIDTAQPTGFEQCYLLLREKEGRLYSDEEVRDLPFISRKHPLRKEWEMRKESSKRLIGYFTARHTALNILEVGCGNGWLSNQLSTIPGAMITGIDINETELKQARKVFPAINFIYGDRIESLVGKKFDAIVFAASFQYFSSGKEILQNCFSCMGEKGEIHILDTHFYTDDESVKAMMRSNEYFASVGFPQMNEFYFHQPMNVFEGFNYDVLYDPGKTLNRIFNRNPFPWIRIKK